jgi:hypothetical protein
MTTKHPNRTREQSTGSEAFRRKRSGEQHMDLPDEFGVAPHRPHRMNRADLQKADIDDDGPDDVIPH